MEDRLTMQEQRLSQLSLAAGPVMNGLGWCGAFFIVYGLLVVVFREPWPLMERFGPRLSSILTIIATCATTLSIYTWEPSSDKPKPVNVKIVGPIVIGSALIALARLVYVGHLSSVTMNGFALLGIAGTLYRIMPIRAEAE